MTKCNSHINCLNIPAGTIGISFRMFLIKMISIAIFNNPAWLHICRGRIPSHSFQRIIMDIILRVGNIHNNIESILWQIE